MKEESKEKKRSLVLETLTFLSKERNKSLFRLSTARLAKRKAIEEEKEAKKQARFHKIRMIRELNNNFNLLTEQDKKKFFEIKKREEDSQ